MIDRPDPHSEEFNERQIGKDARDFDEGEDWPGLALIAVVVALAIIGFISVIGWFV